MSFSRPLLYCLPLLLSASYASAQTAQCEPTKVAQKYPTYAGKVVKIAAAPISPPYTFTDSNNPDRLVGVEAEMIEKVMDCAGLKYEYIKGAWSGLLSSLFSGGSDLMIGAVNYRPDRAAKADFILYFRAGHAVVVKKGNPRRLAGPDTLCGNNGTATVGGSSAQLIERQSKLCVEQGKPPITFMPAADSEGSYRQLPLERFDFVMDDAVTAAVHVSKKPDIEIAHTVISDILSGMVVQKGNSEMQKVVGEGLKILEQKGEIKAIAAKYGFPESLLVPIQTKN